MSNIPKIMKGGKELTSQSVIANALIIEKQIQENEEARNVWETYDPTKKYVKGNKVTDNGSSFLCLQPCQGKRPIDYPTYWLMIASAGAGLSDATQLPIVDTGDYFTAGDTNSALQEIAERVGDLSNLETESNADLVAAVNEIYQALLTHQPNPNQEIEQVASDLAAHKADNTPHREAVSIERKNPDDDGVFTLIEFRRPDGTLFKTSQLNGTSPYNSRTVKYYDKNENLMQTVEYSITYSNDEVISEVIISA